MKSSKPYLYHILEECNFIINNSKDLSFEKFINNHILKRAFVRSLEVIGEAVKNIDSDFKKKYPLIPWKEIAGMRNVIIHEYFGIDYKIVWKTIKIEIPKLKKDIIEIIKKEKF
jgi:uncharacterized protein with HEPN domain